MSSNNTMFLDVGTAENARRIAYKTNGTFSGNRPGLLWLSGFNSTMDGSKATELSNWARDIALPMTRFDYSGHGQSSGQFEDGTISLWLEEATAMMDQVLLGPQILVGSSMGGWLALLIARRIAAASPGRVAGLVLIAPAWDMTERLMWQTAPQDVRDVLTNDRVWHRPSQYDDNNYPITMQLIEDGRSHLFGDDPIDTGCPVRILHGLDDPDVPWQGSEALIKNLTTSDARLTLVKGAGHRLSEPADIRLLQDTVAELLR